MKEMGRKKVYLGAKTGAGIAVQLSKGKDVFIKDYISGDVDASCRNIKALETFVEVAIT